MILDSLFKIVKIHFLGSTLRHQFQGCHSSALQKVQQRRGLLSSANRRSRLHWRGCDRQRGRCQFLRLYRQKCHHRPKVCFKGLLLHSRQRGGAPRNCCAHLHAILRFTGQTNGRVTREHTRHYDGFRQKLLLSFYTSTRIEQRTLSIQLVV